MRNDFNLDNADKIFINKLDKALEKMTNYKGNIIRVLEINNKEQLEKIIKNIEIGKEKTFSEYMSFSNIKGYNDKANIEIYIYSQKAKNIIDFNKAENEILYKRNSKFNVVDKTYKDNKYKIYLEEQ